MSYQSCLALGWLAWRLEVTREQRRILEAMDKGAKEDPDIQARMKDIEAATKALSHNDPHPHGCDQQYWSSPPHRARKNRGKERRMRLVYRLSFYLFLLFVPQQRCPALTRTNTAALTASPIASASNPKRGA